MTGSKTTAPKVGVAILAAGESRRMGGMDKLFAEVAGKPLIAYCLEVFDRSPDIDSIAIATSPANVEPIRRMVAERRLDKVARVIRGGARRQDSALAALERLPDDVEIALVHDAARPFVDRRVIRDAIAAAREHGAAVAAVPVKDTIKVASEDMTIISTPLRDSLWSAQTPQSFERGLLLEAHASVSGDVTDDASMVEAAGHAVKLFMGSYDNIKVTTPEDLYLAEAIARARAGSET